MLDESWLKYPENKPPVRHSLDGLGISVECVVYTPADGFNPFKVAQLATNGAEEEWTDVDDPVTFFKELYVPEA